MEDEGLSVGHPAATTVERAHQEHVALQRAGTGL